MVTLPLTQPELAAGKNSVAGDSAIVKQRDEQTSPHNQRVSHRLLRAEPPLKTDDVAAAPINHETLLNA